MKSTEITAENETHASKTPAQNLNEERTEPELKDLDPGFSGNSSITQNKNDENFGIDSSKTPLIESDKSDDSDDSSDSETHSSDSDQFPFKYIKRSFKKSVKHLNRGILSWKTIDNVLEKLQTDNTNLLAEK